MRKFYDFAVALKDKYKEVKDLPEGTVPYSLTYIPWILKTTADVYNKHHKYYDFNELLSVAFTAAVEAEKKYNPSINSFTTYARFHVIPALDDYVSNMTKTQLELQKKILSFISNYFNEHKMHPCENIILKELNLKEETYRNLLQVIDISYIDEDTEAVLCSELSAEQSIYLDDYFKALDFIDVDYNGILRLKIIDDLPFQIICKRLGLTKEKVQKLYDNALNDLRDELSKRGISKEDLEWMI